MEIDLHPLRKADNEFRLEAIRRTENLHNNEPKKIAKKMPESGENSAELSFIKLPSVKRQSPSHYLVYKIAPGFKVVSVEYEAAQAGNFLATSA